MARLKEDPSILFPTIAASSLQRPVHFIVDMVNGFVKEGALHDPAIGELCPAILALLQRLACRTIFVTDSHPPKTREFLSYPPHCVIGSKEDEVIEELAPYVQQRMRKNSTNTFFAPEFQRFLQEEAEAYRDIVISGCCTDICVMQFALTLNAWLNEHNRHEQRVIVAADTVDTYHIEGVHDAFATNRFALENMKGNGICVVRSIEG